MKRITFYGPNSKGEAKTIRTGTRAIIEKDGRILFSYLGKRHQYLLPGGGMEKGETPRENAIREVQEECGLAIDPKDPFIVVDEYYGDFMWRDYYCVCSITGTVPVNYDLKEIELEISNRWMEKEKAIEALMEAKMDPVDLVGKPEYRLFVTLNSHYREAMVLSLLYGNAIPAIPQTLLNRTLARLEYTET